GESVDARSVNKVHLGVVRMERTTVNAATGGAAQDQRRGRAPAIMRLGHHVDDLVKGTADEIHELELGYRPHSGERGAESCTHNGRFGDRRIDHALRAEVVDEAVGDFE